MKPISLKNIVTGETVICDNIKFDKQYIDGIEFLLVKKQGTTRKFLIRKDAFQKIENNKNGN